MCRPPRFSLLPIVTEIILIGASAVDVEDPASLRVLQEAYPRAFFFRSAEGFAANQRVPYERWDACFSRLMGVEGKVLEEEVPGRSVRNMTWLNNRQSTSGFYFSDLRSKSVDLEREVEGREPIREGWHALKGRGEPRRSSSTSTTPLQGVPPDGKSCL